MGELAGGFVEDGSVLEAVVGELWTAGGRQVGASLMASGGCGS